jgi:segregation and condensation protein B
VSEKLQPILEALVFAADHPLSPREISDWLPEYSIRDIRAALNALEMEYGSMGRSFFLKEVASGYQFRTKREFAPYVLKMYKTSPSRLSQAALETLAIIAYKQPILRQEIEKLRGVDVGGIVRTLLEKGLIRIVGRKNLPGRPFIYGTTKKFLEVFDLTDLNSLPKMKEIKTLFSNGEGAVPALQALEGTSDAIQEEAADEAAPEGPKD